MSLHKSLKSLGTIGGHRNVLSRAERIAKLRGEERWSEGDSVFGLQKVRSIKMRARGKKKEKKEEEEQPKPEAEA